MIGAIIGGVASSLIGGAMQNRANNKQNEEEWKRMEWGATENEAMAIRNHQRNKDMWDYTNYENQIKHMKNAGLSPGLMYGGAGAGVTSAQGGHSGSPGTMIPQGQQRGLEAKQIGLQLGQLASQIEVNKSVAEKNEAEAEKTRGVDTDVAKSQASLNDAIKDIQNSIKELNESNTKLTGERYFTELFNQEKAWQEARQETVKADIAEKTKEDVIAQTEATTYNLMLTGIEKIAGIKLTEKKVEHIGKQIEGFWYDLESKRISADAMRGMAHNQAEKIANDLFLGKENIRQQDEKILQDWIYKSITAGTQISGEIQNWMSRGISKGIQTITQKWIKNKNTSTTITTQKPIE
nr:MAG: replication initiation protein [Microviridae sp.]